MWHCTFWMTSMTLNQHENRYLHQIASLKNEPIGKLIENYVHVFDKKFTRLDFENTCWITWQSLVIKQAFLKPCLLKLNQWYQKTLTQYSLFIQHGQKGGWTNIWLRELAFVFLTKVNFLDFIFSAEINKYPQSLFQENLIKTARHIDGHV